MSKALRGIKIVSLANNLPGPLALMKLRQSGASIIKVEPPLGDPLKRYCKKWYSEITAGQKVIRLDLKSSKGRRKFHECLSGAQVLITHLRPASLKKLGMSAQSLKKKFPTLSYLAVYGAKEDDDQFPGHDLIYQAKAGLLHSRYLPRTLLADLSGAQAIYSTCLEMLLLRERLGKTLSRSLSLVDAIRFYTLPVKHGLTGKGGLMGGSSPRYAIYQCKNGWIALAALEDLFWQRLLSELRLRNVEQNLPSLLAAAFMKKTSYQWESWARKLDIPLAALPHLDQQDE